MSKPLAFIFQLIGLVLIVQGWVSESIGPVVWGIGLAAVGGYGLRQRIKQESKQK